jgi:RES domain-containing protein
MQAFRITKAAYAKHALSGEGGLFSGGRWHHAGRHVVYLASSLSLAALEVFVHLRRTDLAIKFAYVVVDIPDDLPRTVIEPSQLPPSWRSVPPAEATMAMGDVGLDSMETAILQVPSVLSVVEFNLLINPRHPDAERIMTADPKPFAFDPRMWK